MTAPAIDAVAVIRQRTVPLIEELLPIVERLPRIFYDLEALEATAVVLGMDDDCTEDGPWQALRHETGVNAVCDLLRQIGAFIEKGLGGSCFAPIDGVGRFPDREDLLKALRLPDGLIS